MQFLIGMAGGSFSPKVKFQEFKWQKLVRAVTMAVKGACWGPKIKSVALFEAQIRPMTEALSRCQHF